MEAVSESETSGIVATGGEQGVTGGKKTELKSRFRIRVFKAELKSRFRIRVFGVDSVTALHYIVIRAGGSRS